MSRASEIRARCPHCDRSVRMRADYKPNDLASCTFCGTHWIPSHTWEATGVPKSLERFVKRAIPDNRKKSFQTKL